MSEPLPSLEALRCLAEAARLRDFRAAARAVGLTPAALGPRRHPPLVLRGDGASVLPGYFVRQDLEAGRLARLLPHIELLADYLRLVVRGDDPRRTVYERIGQAMMLDPLE